MKTRIIDKYGNIKKINYGKLEKTVLELGCGEKRKVGNSITIDIVNFDDVDIVGNLNECLSSFRDSTVDEIHSFHLLEHIDDLESFMGEINRILKNGGLFMGTVPHFSNPYFYSDYTHKHFFGLYSFSYFEKGQYFKRKIPQFYNKSKFVIVKIKLVFRSPFFTRRMVKRVFGLIINSCGFMKEFFEENFCYLYPAYEIEYVLKKENGNI